MNLFRRLVKLVYLIITVQVFPTTLLAAAIITSYSGILSENNHVIISGTNFGSMDGEIISWDNFESHSIGENVNQTYPIIGPRWTTFKLGPSTDPVIYSNSHKHSGNKAVLIEWNNETINAFGWWKQGPFSQLYITYWRYMEGNYYPTTCNHKQFYLYGNSNQMPQGMPLIPAGGTTWGFYNNEGVGYNLPNNKGWSYNNTKETFQRWEFWLKLNNPQETANGIVKVWLDCELGINSSSYRHRVGNNGEWDSFMLGHMAQGMLGSAKAWFDDLYIATTQARVEIGNASTWNACTHREVQIVGSWSDTSIEFTVNQGTFNNGDPVYLYVIKADGSVSNGYRVIFGQSSGPDTTTPVATNFNPASGATGVPIDSNIILHIQDNGDGVDQSTIKMTVNGQQVTPSITGSTSDYTVTYDPPSDFGYNSVVTVTINASDLAGNAMAPVSYSFTTEAAPDTTPPVVEITSPTTDSSYSTDSGTVSIAGSASDNVAVNTVSWFNSAGGSGVATGTSSWTVSNIILAEGQNIITVTAEDSSGNTASDTITVNYSPSEGTHTATFGDVTGADYPGTVSDTYLNINDENNVSGTTINTYTWPVNMVANAGIIKWNLSSIPSSATIQSAKLYLYLVDSGGDSTYTVSVHKIINHDPVLGSCNGYTYDGTNSWTANSQCYNNIPLAQADISTAEDSQDIGTDVGYKVWDITNMVKDWVSNPATNYGVLINSDGQASQDSYRYFASSEYSDSTKRPKLVITYTVGPAPDTTPPAPPTGVNITIEK